MTKRVIISRRDQTSDQWGKRPNECLPSFVRPFMSAPKRTRLEEVIAQIPEACSDSDSENYEPTEFDLKRIELNQIEHRIDKLEEELKKLREKRSMLIEDMDNDPEGRYEPSSPCYSPTSS